MVKEAPRTLSIRCIDGTEKLPPNVVRNVEFAP